MFSRGDFHMPALKKVLCDGGCTGEAFAAQIKALTGAETAIAKRSELHKFEKAPEKEGIKLKKGMILSTGDKN
jgi:hypothetical protein